jgi:xanthine dehydrogenase accessory factor
VEQAMMDRRRIVRQWKEGGARVLVTLVGVEGSSYRRPGANLLVGADGAFAGTISGGCLEAEAVRKASWMVRGGAAVERYSTLFDDTAEIPFGLGCGGVVDVLFEPVDTPECAAFLEAMEASLHGDESFVVTCLPRDGQPLARAVYDASGRLVFLGQTLDAATFASIRISDLIAGNLPSQPGVFVEKVAAPQRLFVLGAGDDARPVVRMAALLGWNVTVADARPQFARPERFPEAERVLSASSIRDLAIACKDAAVVMTHSYEQDRALLTGLLADPSAPGYIGLLGAIHRSSLLVSEAAAALRLSVAACCARIHAPVGLDLGGDGPEAIALAVIAQVHAWSQDRPGAGRRLTAEQVAGQIAQGGPSRYMQAQCELSPTASSGS